MKKIYIIIAFFTILIFTILILKDKIKLIYTSLNSFKPENLSYTFQNTKLIQPTTSISPSDKPFYFKENLNFSLPTHFYFKNKEYDTYNFIKNTETTALLIIKNDTIRYEKYYKDGNKNTNFSSNSIGKSFISALIGIAISEGYIESVDDYISKYIPEFKGTELEKIPIKACLQMASGIDFDEENDLSKFSIKTLLGFKSMKILSKCKISEPPFTHRKYLSINTEILGEIIRNSTGYTLSEFMEEKLWKKIGTEKEAFWTLNNNKELAMGGLNITIRDFARFGRLYLNEGKYNNNQIISKEYIKESFNIETEYSRPFANNDYSNIIGYGYQWWIPSGNEKEFLAIGVFGQYLYVNPEKNIIIVKTSADSNFNTNEYDIKYIDFFRAISNNII